MRPLGRGVTGHLVAHHLQVKGAGEGEGKSAKGPQRRKAGRLTLHTELGQAEDTRGEGRGG